MVSGADNGTMYFWDWKTGYNFQRFQVHISSEMWKEASCLVFKLKEVHLLFLLGSSAAWISRLGGRDLPDEVRPVGLEADHLRG